MFGVDLTWLGWVFVVDMIFSAVIHIAYMWDGERRRTETESFWAAICCIAYLVGFFTVGFVH